MKAFVIKKYGSPIVEFDIPEPEVASNEVLVQMVAAGINPADERIRSGGFKQIFPFTLPLVMGSEFSGEVIAVGSHVTDFQLGMQVYAYPDLARMGAFAERIVIHEDHLAIKPESLSTTQAAALPVATLTAWQGLVEMGQLRAGQTVLIHGGSGGVGSIAIQLAKHLGATVATTVSAGNAEFVRDLGADIIIDYQAEDFNDHLSNVDLVLDTQGGATLKRSMSVVRPGGMVIGLSGPPDPQFATRVGVNKGVKLAISGMSWGARRRARKLGITYRFLFIRSEGDHLRSIAKLVDDRVITPIIDRSFPFSEVPQALNSLLQDSARGKILVKGIETSATTQ